MSLHRTTALHLPNGARGPTLSIRTIWPFARLMRDYEPELNALRSAGVTEVHLADPDVRLSEELMLIALRKSVEKTHDPALGIHAAEALAPGDYGPIDHASRHCATFREAAQCWQRYMPLIDEGTRIQVTETGSRAVWSLAALGARRDPAANDFAVMSSLFVGLRLLGEYIPPIEVHLRHEVPTDEAEYRRAFNCPVKLGQPANAVVFQRRVLDLPLSEANRDFRYAFETQAAAMLERLPASESVAWRVRNLVLGHIGSNDIGMPAMAKHLHMSVATLRRRLEDEGTSHRQVVEEARRELAIHYLQGFTVGVTEIAFLLGFSSVQSFSRAFRTWTGMSPMDYRTDWIARQ